MITILLSNDTVRLQEYAETNYKRVAYFPECRQHPKMIAEIVEDLLTTSIEAIVTHSDAIVNIIGHLIYQNKLSNSAVDIKIVFDNEVLSYQYNDEGYIENWYIGFFDWLND